MDRRLIRPPAVAADRLAARLVEGFEVSARRLDVAGVSTALLEGGSGPPVVLLHGHGGFAESLAETIAELVDRYRVIAPDLPGLGRSELHRGQLGPSGLVDWLGRMIAATCTTPPILVGFSAGAGLALRHTLTARQVRRVVLVSPCSLGPLRLPLPVRRIRSLRPQPGPLDSRPPHPPSVPRRRPSACPAREPLHGHRGLRHRASPATRSQGRQPGTPQLDLGRRAASRSGARVRDLRKARPDPSRSPTTQTPHQPSRLAARRPSTRPGTSPTSSNAAPWPPPPCGSTIDPQTQPPHQQEDQ